MEIDIAKTRETHAALTKDLKLDQWHRYTRKKVVYTGVTSALGMIDKSRVLMAWAAREQLAVDRMAAIDVALTVAADPSLNEYSADVRVRNVAGDLFDALVPRAEAAHKLTQAAIDLGHQVHSLIEHEINSRLGIPMADPVVSDRAIELLAPWTEWAERVDLKPVLSEFAVFSEPFGLAGTGDLLGFVNGRLTLIDWKTSKRIYFESHLQNVAYRHLLHGMGLLPPGVEPGEVDGLVVRIPKLKTDEPVCETSQVDVGEDSERWGIVRDLARLSVFMKKSEKRWKAEGR